MHLLKIIRRMGASNSAAHLIILGAISSKPIAFFTQIFLISSRISYKLMYFRYMVDLFSLPMKSENLKFVFCRPSASVLATLVKWLLRTLAISLGHSEVRGLVGSLRVTFSGYTRFFLFLPKALLITSQVARLSSLFLASLSRS